MNASLPWLRGDPLAPFTQPPPWLTAPQPTTASADLAPCLAPAALARAFVIVRRSSAAGIDGITPERFAERLDRRLRELSRDLLSGRYRPAPLLRLHHPKPDGGVRTLAIPTVADRIVQRAVLDAVEGDADARLLPQVHGWRRGRSTASAIRALLAVGTLPWLEAVKADVASLFDTLPHHGVRATAACLRLDPLWLALVERWLEAWPSAPGRGVPQGAPLSPLFANLFLAHHLDRLVGNAPRAWVRYGDDLLAVFDRPGAGVAWLAWLDGVVRHAGLSLSPAKVGWAPPTHGPLAFSALGHRLAIAPAPGGWRLEPLP